MSYLFSGGQVADLAVRIERNGIAFYEAAKEKAQSEDAKKVFEYLIGEEKKHLASFQGLLKDLELVRPPEQYEGEWDAYLATAAEEHVFSEDKLAQDVIASISGEKDAVGFAIGFEKDSILLFYELSTLVEGKNKEIVDRLVMEEKQHLRTLSKLKKSIG